MRLYLAHGFLTRQWSQDCACILLSVVPGGGGEWTPLGKMKLHLAERDPQHHAWPKRGVDKKQMKLRILLSYWYYKDIDLDQLFAKYFARPYPDVFADSGAFSAMTQGVQISCDEYADWVKRWKHLFSVYANLDVIKDAETTWKNQKYLEDKHGLTPLPTFHVLEDWQWLERYIEQYPYVALGVAGMQQRKDAMMRWLVKCFRMAQDKAVFHGFALTSWEVMKSFPWYSVDSSSWGQGFRFGQVPLFDTDKGKFIKVSLGDYRAWRKQARLVKRLGFNPLDFADRERNDRAKICAISALSYMLAEQWLRQHHGEVKIPTRPGVGVRLHLADANPKRFNEALQGANGDRLHLVDTSNGINWSDAQKTLPDESGPRIHLVDSHYTPLKDTGAADQGIKIHLADSRPHTAGDLASGQTGLKIHLAEHSLDRGG